MTVQNGAVASPATENLDPIDTAQATDAASGGLTEDANSAQSSGADNEDAKQSEPENLLDVVKSAVEPKAEAGEASSTSEAGTEEVAEASPEEGEAEADPADADVPFHKHPRWQEMKAERDAYKADADRFQQITSFMAENRLTDAEVSEGFAVMAALKSGSPNDLQAAYDWFASNTQRLAESLGHALPADIQAKVAEGYMDEEIAQELAKERAKAALLAQQAQQQQEASEQAQQAQQLQALQADMVTAVQTWEEGIRAKDPDYATKKAVLVEDQVRAIVQRRGGIPPQSRDDAIALANQAYAEVNERIRAFVPKPKPVTPPPAGLSARATTAPASFREAIFAAVNR